MVKMPHCSTSPHERRFAQALHHGIVVHHHRGFGVADARYGLAQDRRQIEFAAFPIAGQVLRAAVDRAVFLDDAGTADADERRHADAFAFCRRDQAFEHLDQIFDRVFALHVGLVAVAPQRKFPDIGLGEVGRLFQVEPHDAGANIGAADVDGENRIIGLEHPGRGEVRAAEQARLVRIVVNRHQIDLDLVGLEHHRGAADDQLADPAGAKAAADGEPLDAHAMPSV